MDVSIKDMRSVIETANDIRTSIDKWYEISGQMRLFYDQLRRLGDEHQIWEDKVNKFGLSDDLDLLQKIRDAQATLDKEKDTLFGKNGRARRFRKIIRWVFPAKLESSIRRVTALCEDLKRFDLTKEEQIEAVARQRALQRVPSFPFTSDRRYFPLIEMEEKVKKELRKPGEPSIILLYGGSGTGKSALARNLSLHFQRETKERSGGPLSYSSQSSNSSGALFERVLFLECGPEVSLEAKQREVVQLLDPSPSYDTASADANGKRHLITTLLSSLLKQRSLLIILDDVWKCEKKPEWRSDKMWPSFLKGMIRYGGPRVKWLITSQHKDLCNHLDIGDPCCLRMEEIERITARQILQSLTGLKEHIPELQDIMDRIISKIGSNLYALTCVASNISLERHKEEEEWRRLETRVKDNFVATLKSENEVKMQGIHSPNYWAATQLCFERLTPSEQHLLHLMQICDRGPSVPSSVIEFFFQQTEKRDWYEGFSNAKKELEGKQLLTIQRKTTIIPERLSVHDLLKLFIEKNLETSVDSMIETFVEEKSTSKVHSDIFFGVADFYFNEDCRKRLAKKMNFLLSKKIVLLYYLNRPVPYLRITITILLTLVTRWVSGGGFYKLVLINTMVVALVFVTTEWFLCSVFQRLRFQTILDKLSSGLLVKPSEVNNCCAVAIAEIALGSDVIKERMIDVPSLLQNLMLAIGRDDSPYCQTEAACALSNLTKGPYVRSDIIACKGVLKNLASLMVELDNPGVTKQCARALANLAVHDDVKTKIIDVPNLLQNLITAMGRDDSPDCQAEAACVLSNLASGGDVAVRKMMATCPEIVDVLVDAMGKRVTRTISGLENIMFALTLLSPTRAKEMELDSQVDYLGRARGELILGFYKECLEDCDKAMASLNETPTDSQNALDAKRSIFTWRCCAKAKLGDFQDALADANSLVQMANVTKFELAYALQERGVVKRMMDDLPGALVDLDASLKCEADDDYEVLKHRGFVKFLLQDEEGARADAKRALECKPNCFGFPGYALDCLGGTSVRYLDFEL